MKRKLLSLLLAGLLALSGCSAMLNQTYTRIEPAEERLSVGEDPSVIEVETRSALTSAVLSLVRQGVDHGVIRLKNYRGDVEADLSAACLEVAQEDPLGSYAVEGIKHDCSHIISYYEANIYITYRRTREQVSSIVKVTGSSAIRTELKTALAAFAPEVLLQVSYFSEDEAYIRDLVRQAYYETPVAALGMPGISVTLYPAETGGYQRVVEIQLSYAESPEALRKKSAQLVDEAEAIWDSLLPPDSSEALSTAFSALRECAAYLPPDPQDPAFRGTAWHVFTQGGADSEGFALAMTLFCQRLRTDCMVVSGTLEGQPHYWNIVRLADGEYRHVDATDPDGFLLSDAAMLELGYAWDRADGSIPLCGEQPPEPTPSPEELEAQALAGGGDPAEGEAGDAPAPAESDFPDARGTENPGGENREIGP